MPWIAIAIFAGCWLIGHAIEKYADALAARPVVLYTAPGIPEPGTPMDSTMEWLQQEPRSIVAPLVVYSVRGVVRVLVLRKPGK